MEVEGNQATGNTSIDAQTVLKKTVFFFWVEGWKRDGGVKTKIQLKTPMGNCLISHKPLASKSNRIRSQ